MAVLTPKQYSEVMEKFETRAWLKTPWENHYWFNSKLLKREHYSHISVEDKTKVAFISAATSDKYTITRMRPGRYLTSFYSDILAPVSIRNYAAEFVLASKDFELKFAHSPDDIENVYRNGPSSCMGGKTKSFKSDIHPCRVYGAGDLAVAYIENENKISARAVVWPEKKVYYEAYGDGGSFSTAFQRKLENAGYTRGEIGCFTGARLLKIPHGDGYVAPYVDGHEGIIAKGDHLVIVESAYRSYSANSQSGIIGDSICSFCEEYAETPYTLNNEDCCEDCFECYGYYCEECGDTYHIDNSHRVGDYGDMVCESCYNRNYSECDGCGNSFRTDYLTPPEDSTDHYCEGCLCDYVTNCDECYGDFVKVEESPVDSFYRCEDCHKDHMENYRECEECGDYIAIEKLNDDDICSDCEGFLEEEKE